MCICLYVIDLLPLRVIFEYSLVQPAKVLGKNTVDKEDEIAPFSINLVPELFECILHIHLVEFEQEGVKKYFGRYFQSCEKN